MDSKSHMERGAVYGQYPSYPLPEVDDKPIEKKCVLCRKKSFDLVHVTTFFQDEYKNIISDRKAFCKTCHLQHNVNITKGTYHGEEEKKGMLKLGES